MWIPVSVASYCAPDATHLLNVIWCAIPLFLPFLYTVNSCTVHLCFILLSVICILSVHLSCAGQKAKMLREKLCWTVALVMSVSCPGHLLPSHLNSWNDDDIDPCRCSQLPLGSELRDSMQQPCKSTLLLKIKWAGQRVWSVVASVLQHASRRCDLLQVFPLNQHLSKIILESGHLFPCVSASSASILPWKCYLCKNN